MTGYLSALIARAPYRHFFASNVGLRLMGTDQKADGRDGVEAIIRYLHEHAFDAHPELRGLLVDGERAAIEADFVGQHIGELAGKPATRQEVRVPYSVISDLDGQEITALRIYMPLDALIGQFEG